MHNGSGLGVRDDRCGGLGQGRRRQGFGPGGLTFLQPGTRTHAVARGSALVQRRAQTDVMARKRPSTEQTPAKRASAPPRRPGRPSALLYSRVVSCGERLDEFCELPDRCVDLIYIDRPFNSNHNDEVFWGETKERAAFEERRASALPQSELDIP